MSLDGDGPWELDVDGFEIKKVRYSAHGLQITASGVEANAFKIKFEGPLEFRDSTDWSQSLDPQSPAALDALLALCGDTIQLALVTSRSELHIEFASGRALDCACDGLSETWRVIAPDGIFVVGVPGGGEPAISR